MSRPLEEKIKEEVKRGYIQQLQRLEGRIVDLQAELDEARRLCNGCYLCRDAQGFRPA